MNGFLKIANFRITKYGSWQDLIIPSENQDKAGDQMATDSYPFDLEAILGEDRFKTIAEKRDKFLFMTAIAVTADKANDNGDYFPKDELIEAYPTFVRRGIYMNHDNDKPEKAVGVILGSYWDESEENVKILAAVSRDKAAKTCRKVETGIITDVSMGCFCKSSECSKCQHVATSDEELCECTSQLRASKYDGSVYEINRGLVFIECSIIDETGEGADPEAKIMDKMAKLVKQADLNKLGQEAPTTVVPLVEMKFLEDGRMLIKILKAKELTVDKLVTILIDSGFAPSGFTKDDLFTPSKGVIVSMGDTEAEVILPKKTESDAGSAPAPEVESEPTPEAAGGGDMTVEPARKRVAQRILIDHASYGSPTEFDSVEEAEQVVRDLGDDFADTEFFIRGDEVVDDRGDVVGEVILAKKTAAPVPPQMTPSPTGDMPAEDKYQQALDYINVETKKGRGYDEVEMEAKQKFQLEAQKGVQPVSPDQGAGGGPVDMSQPEGSDVQMEMPQDQFAPNSKVLLTGTTGTVQEVTPEGKLMITIDGLDSNVLVEPDQVSPYNEEEQGTGDVDYEADDVLGGEPPSVMKNEMKRLEKRFGIKIGTKVEMPDGSKDVGVIRAIYADGTAQITPLTAQDLMDEMGPIEDAIEDVEQAVEESGIEEYADIIEYLLESYLDGVEFVEAVEAATEYGLEIPPPEKLEEIINSIFDDDDEGDKEGSEDDVDEMSGPPNNDNEGIEMEGGEKEAMSKKDKKAQRRERPVKPVEKAVVDGGNSAVSLTPKERMAKRLEALVRKRAEEKTKAKGGQGETYEYPKSMNAPGKKAPKNPLDEYSTKGHEETVPDIKSGFEYSKGTSPADVSPQTVNAMKRMKRQIRRLEDRLAAEKTKIKEATEKLAAIESESAKAAKEVKAKRVIAIVNHLDGLNQFDSIADKKARAAQLMVFEDNALDEIEGILANESADVIVPEETSRTANKIPRLASKRGADSFDQDLKDACMTGI